MHYKFVTYVKSEALYIECFTLEADEMNYSIE